MPDDRSPLSIVSPSSSWRDCCPWLMLLRTVSVSISLQALLLATAGLVLMNVAWLLANDLFAVQDEGGEIGRAVLQMQDGSVRQLNLNHKLWSHPLPAAAGPSPRNPGFVPRVWDVIQGAYAEPFYQAWAYLGEPFVQLFRVDVTLRDFCRSLCGGLLSLLIWALLGGAIVRLAVVQLAREQRLGMKDAVLFATRKLGSLFVSPLMPLLGAAGLGLVVAVPSLLLRLDLGVFLAGILWILALVAGALMAVLLLGLLFGWPLMWGTIAAEGTDSFDALSRSYAYTYQRPLHYLGLAVFAGLLGALAWLLVATFAEMVVALTWWGASWGAGRDRIAEIQDIMDGVATDHSLLRNGAWLIGFWIAAVRTLAQSFIYSFFWTATAGIYLLLRREVDQADLDEVYLDEEAEAFGLPELAPDAAGVPGVPAGAASHSVATDEPPPAPPAPSGPEEDRAADLGG